MLPDPPIRERCQQLLASFDRHTFDLPLISIERDPVVRLRSIEDASQLRRWNLEEVSCCSFLTALLDFTDEGLGAPLARAETDIAIEALLEQFEVLVPDDSKRIPFQNGLEELPCHVETGH